MAAKKSPKKKTHPAVTKRKVALKKLKDPEGPTAVDKHYGMGLTRKAQHEKVQSMKKAKAKRDAYLKKRASKKK